jgi:hypothetical protein
MADFIAQCVVLNPKAASLSPEKLQVRRTHGKLPHAGGYGLGPRWLNCVGGSTYLANERSSKFGIIFLHAPAGEPPGRHAVIHPIRTSSYRVFVGAGGADQVHQRAAARAGGHAARLVQAHLPRRRVVVRRRARLHAPVGECPRDLGEWEVTRLAPQKNQTHTPRSFEAACRRVKAPPPRHAEAAMLRG